MEYTHPLLVIKAARWLERKSYWPVLTEFVCGGGEVPDAIGWKMSFSTLIEVKVSRADFLGECRRKKFRSNGANGIGHRRYYLCPHSMIQPHELTGPVATWGLLWFDGYRIHEVKESEDHYERNDRQEIAMLVTALRRVQTRIQPLSMNTFLRAAGDVPLYMIKMGGRDPQFKLEHCKHLRKKDVKGETWCLECGSPLSGGMYV